MTQTTPTGVLDAEVVAEIDGQLASTDAALSQRYPGDDGRRQPVHTVYVPADRFASDLPIQWGRQAEALVDRHGGAEALCATLDLDASLHDAVATRIEAKLATQPIEDLRVDFEDGYGNRDGAIEDAHAVAVATALAATCSSSTAPSFFGIRFKCFEAPTRHRGLRTLDLFLSALLDEMGALPTGFVLTLPKVSTVSQVQAMVRVCEALEDGHGLTAGSLTFEIQVETPPLIIGADGLIPVVAAIHAGDGRVTSLHYGTFDYSASLQIAAAHQSADHPAADFAKNVMQVAIAGTGVHMSDGSTNIIPIGSAAQVETAWSTHAGLVRRALARGIYQGWDMHPGHLPTRFAETFAFFRGGYPRAAQRLSDYAARVEGDIMDEPATVRALARFLDRGLGCGALDDSEVQTSAAMSTDQIRQLARPGSDTEQVQLPEDHS